MLQTSFQKFRIQKFEHLQLMHLRISNEYSETKIAGSRSIRIRPQELN